MIAFELLAPQIRWMEGQPGDPFGLAYLLLTLLALAAFLTVRRILRKRKPFRSNLTKQLLEMPVRRFRKKHRGH